MRGTIFSRTSQFICYADDVDIVGRRFDAVAEQYTVLKREAEKVALRVNTSKTKYLLAGCRTGEDRNRIRSGSLTMNGDEFEVVEEFVYLGSLVTSDDNCSRETRRRIIARSRAYYGLHKTLRSGKLHRNTKCTMYRTLIRPVVLYGYESWTMLEEDLRALEVFERRVLRTIFGGVQERVGGRLVWRRRMNHELAQLFGGPSIRKVTKAGRIRWMGHVVRMPDNNPAKLVFASEGPEERRRRGGQRAKWRKIWKVCIAKGTGNKQT